MLKRTLALAVALAAMAGASGAARAVSDGNYDPAKNHCTGHADNADGPYAGLQEDGCYAAIVHVDGDGHEFVGAGVRQTADGDFANTMDVWVDPGLGTKYVWTFYPDGPSGPAEVPSDIAAPRSSLRVYFGADDNLDVGEHDSSDQIDNGPSDGGGIQINVNPLAVTDWIAGVTANPASYLLTHPLPIADAGIGACADGICFTVQSQKRLILDGGARKERDVANYAGKEWDPITCDGPDDTEADCSDATHPNFTLADWFALEGKVFAEPGIQIYEDPDPQASPAAFGFLHVPADDPYPLPAFYFGTCGAIIGGGQMDFTGSPNANSAGQLVFPTAC